MIKYYMLFIFDMGGVVTNTFDGDLLYKKLNVNKNQFLKICEVNNSDLWNDFECGFISTNEFWKNFNKNVQFLQRNFSDSLLKTSSLFASFKNIDINSIPEVKTDLFRLYFHPSKNPKTIELIEKLKINNRVVCGTNTNQSHWENHLERGDYSFFNQTYASNKIGIIKPDLSFFTTILEAENFKPEDSFFTDDKLENCDAANQLGIHTVHFTTADDLIFKWGKFI